MLDYIVLFCMNNFYFMMTEPCLFVCAAMPHLLLLDVRHCANVTGRTLSSLRGEILDSTKLLIGSYFCTKVDALYFICKILVLTCLM